MKLWIVRNGRAMEPELTFQAPAPNIWFFGSRTIWSTKHQGCGVGGFCGGIGYL